MYINHSKAAHNIWLQLKWKVKVHREKMIALLFIQALLVMMFSNSITYFSAGFGAVLADILTPSLDVYAVGSALYMFMLGLYIGTTSNVRENLTIPTTRTLTNVSNSLYLLFVSCVTTIVSYSSLYITTAYQLIFHQENLLVNLDEMFSMGHFIGFICFMLLVSAAGYLLACLFQLRIWLGIVVIVISWLAFQTEFMLFEKLFYAIVEGEVWLYSLKCFISALGLYAIAYLLTAKLEVN